MYNIMIQADVTDNEVLPVAICIISWFKQMSHW